MALITCPECTKRISNTAQACPNCGYDLKAAKKKLEQSKAAKGELVPVSVEIPQGGSG